MSKKLTLALAAVAVVLALVIPATATAEDVLLPVGTQIKVSTTKGFTIASSKLGNITCSEGTWEGELNENGGKLLIKSMKGSAKECKSTSGASVVMNSTFIEPTKIEEGEVEKGKLSWKFNLTVNGTVTCTLTSTTATFAWTIGGDKSAFNEDILTVTPVACGTSAKILFAETTDQYKNEKGAWEPVKWL
jgi:hypothetical protein